LDKAKFVVITRPYHHFNLKKINPKFKNAANLALKKVILIKLNIPISATEIRKKIKKGESVNKILPKKVLKYIEEKGLYMA